MLEVCPGYTEKTTTLLADIGINDRLVKLRSLIDQSCFGFINVSYVGAVNFLPQNTAESRCCILLNKPHFGSLYAN